MYFRPRASYRPGRAAFDVARESLFPGVEQRPLEALEWNSFDLPNSFRVSPFLRIVEVIRLGMADLVLFTPHRVVDARGFFSETYNQAQLAKLGIHAKFVQDNHSLSVQKGTIRGLHFQAPPHAQDKLIRVCRGAIFDVAVDIRYGSPSYGQAVSVELSADNWRQLWVPKGFAHGFCTLEPDTEVIYKVTDIYAPECDKGLAWDDPDLNIEWPVAREKIVLSDKDRGYPRLGELPAYFRVEPDLT